MDIAVRSWGFYMCALTAQSNASKTRGGEAAKVDPRRLEKARAIFTSLAKYINAKTIYTANNPNVVNFARGLSEAFRAFFEDEKELILAVEQYQIKWRDEVVYTNLK